MEFAYLNASHREKQNRHPTKEIEAATNMWKAIATTLVAIFAVWLWKVFSWVWLEPRRVERLLRKQGFRGNPYKLLYGDTKEIAQMFKEVQSKPLGLRDDINPRIMPFVLKTLRTYGKNSYAWIGPRPRVYISDPDMMREALTKHTSFQKNFRVTNKINKMLVGGLVEFEGEKWTWHRTKLNPAFHVDKLKKMIPSFQSSSEKIVNEWKKKMKAGSGVVDVADYLGTFTSSAVATGLFNHELDAEMKMCFETLKDLSLIANIAIKTFDIPGTRFLPSAALRKARAMEERVLKAFRKMINDRIEKRRAGFKENGHSDLLDLFLDELYDENKVTEVDADSVINDAIGNLKLFFFAGNETTLNLLIWTMVLLAIYPDWQTRAREEIFHVLGNRKKLHPDETSQLKLVNMIILEVLRLYPSVFELSRVVEEDTKLGNYIIPKGIQMQLPISLINRNPDIWGKDAGNFRPDRFSEGILKASNGHGAYMPFGWGPRICQGQNFAILESKIFLSTLLQTFTWELSSEYIHAPYCPFTLQPQHGAPLLLHEI